jgi:hypothetical protein
VTTSAEMFKKYGAVHVSGFLPQQIAQYLTHILLVKNAQKPQLGDEQCPNSIAIGHGEPACEALLEKCWPMMEIVIGEELLPTYSYARVYRNGDELKRHTDRPACEVSATIQLGRSHHYAWPIFMGKQRFDMAEGDAIIYAGCDIEHWREPCVGPNNYYSGQVFLHYEKANGQHARNAGDNRWSVLPFSKNRIDDMERK